MNETSLPRLDSRAAFADAVRWMVADATSRGVRRITCVDPDFAEWPLDDATVLRQLTDWFKRPQRQLVLLAAHYDAMPRRHPRFVAWRADWAHTMASWAPPEGERVDLPSAMFDDEQTSLELFDPVRWRGQVQRDARATHELRERIDALLQRSVPAFPVNSLGLL